MTRITMTGVDANTDISLLPNGVEYGVLFTEFPEARRRYPQRNEILSILVELQHRRLPSTLHVCGGGARRSLLAGAINCLTMLVDRIQVNGLVTEDELTAICTDYPNHEIITQATKANEILLDCRFPNHSLLVDGSGGRGISPREWTRPETDKRVGFAGGLGPRNVVTELSRIQEVAVGGWWIDMEGKLRDQDGWFSVAAANEVAIQTLAALGVV